MNIEDKKDMQMIINEHINLGLIEPGISAYSSPGFLVRNHGEIKRGIFIKDLAKYRKDFRSLLKETESVKWKWEEIHTQRVRELKQVCNNLPKLAIPQDKDELVIYTDTNDYRWAVVLMKKTTAGEEPYLNKNYLVASTSLWNDLREPIRKASSSEMTNELWEHDLKHTSRVQGSKPVAADLSTACTRPSPDSGETVTNESQRVQASDDSSQPNASGVKVKEINFRQMTDTSKALIILFFCLVETAGKGLHPVFHFIKLQRPDMVAFNRIKAASEETPLVSAISKDYISTKRAWGLWVCLTKIDKVKYLFKILFNKVNGSFLLNSMTRKSTEFVESMFEKKRMLIWENKLPATQVTRMKTYNMLHVGQWYNHECSCCEK
ncbi:UNVERIFIED_CONTAM: hypothetical protein Sangu_2448800 [Sesamum angustifolium]|uniref:Reverse transcriptase/retrotransposon-derived protein RNase H-like domain-containing protein n=1 Tax=Sesamum angustifolium TaxID=2727405 RepID=A0AAW2KZB9_9LAMI